MALGSPQVFIVTVRKGSSWGGGYSENIDSVWTTQEGGFIREKEIKEIDPEVLVSVYPKDLKHGGKSAYSI